MTTVKLIQFTGSGNEKKTAFVTSRKTTTKLRGTQVNICNLGCVANHSKGEQYTFL